MESAIREYDAKLDSKKRLTLREAGFEYYHVSVLPDQRIVLEPRVLTAPFETKAALQEAKDILSGKVSAKSYSSARELFDELDAE